MTRLRIALVLLFIALAIPVGALVIRALASAEIERRVRYETVSERIFDEMERTLSDFLVREEARSPIEYRFQADRERSGRPPAQPPAEPFIVAYFEIAPDGSLRTPLGTGEGGGTIGLAGGDALSAAERARVERAVEVLEREVAPFWRDVGRRRLGEAGGTDEFRLVPEDRNKAGKNQAPDAASPAAPSNASPARIADEFRSKLEKATSPLAKQDGASSPADGDFEATAAVEREGEDEPASAYQVLQSLNVAAKKRAERREQLAEIEASPYARIAESPKDIATSEFDERTVPDDVHALARQDDGGSTRSGPARLPSTGRVPPSAPLPPMPAANLERSSESAATAERVTRSDALREESVAERRPAERIRVTLEPMAGRPLGEQYWMLYRTVVVEGEGYRQGLVLDRRALGRWLSDQVIGSGPLAELATARFDDAGTEPADSATYVAVHPFAEPFSGLEVELRVAPLRDSDSATTIHLLAALLAVVAILGLGSVYRMAAVVVDFANRRSNFVAAVSHELKTPLTAIRMHGEMLRDGLVVDDAKRRDYYRTITDESERLSRLIDNVLEFSRLEKKGRSLVLVVGSPAPIVEDIVERLRPHAERAGFELKTTIADGLPTVCFDRDALTQMLFNLVDNAIKYAAGATRREIIVCCDHGEGGGVVVSVRDFGPGVPRDHLARIFQPFHRVEDELTRSTKGSGIGLSLVRQLGDAMGAAVQGINRPDGGFEVRIDLARATPA